VAGEGGTGERKGMTKLLRSPNVPEKFYSEGDNSAEPRYGPQNLSMYFSSDAPDPRSTFNIMCDPSSFLEGEEMPSLERYLCAQLHHERGDHTDQRLEFLDKDGTLREFRGKLDLRLHPIEPETADKIKPSIRPYCYDDENFDTEGLQIVAYVFVGFYDRIVHEIRSAKEPYLSIQMSAAVLTDEVEFRIQVPYETAIFMPHMTMIRRSEYPHYVGYPKDVTEFSISVHDGKRPLTSDEVADQELAQQRLMDQKYELAGELNVDVANVNEATIRRKEYSYIKSTNKALKFGVGLLLFLAIVLALT
jgi:hypothetical protein